MFNKKRVKKQQQERLILACIRKAKNGYVLNDQELEIAQTAVDRFEVKDAESADAAVEKAIKDWKAWKKMVKEAEKERDEFLKEEAKKEVNT